LSTVRGAATVAAGQQRGQGGGEAEPFRCLRQVERFDAEPVAGQDQPPGVLLDDGEGEHAVEAVHTGRAPLLVSLEDDLGVGVGQEVVAEGAQFLPQFPVVVDAAVEDTDHPPLGVGHGLGAALGQSDDLQAAVAEGDRPLGPQPAAVGAPGREPVGHPLDGRDVGPAVVEADLTAEAAHQADLLPARRPAGADGRAVATARGAAGDKDNKGVLDMKA
jgi:hypothetical protein